MLNACRVLSPVRLCYRSPLIVVQSSPFFLGRGHLEGLPDTKVVPVGRGKRKRKPPATTGVISVRDDGFREMNARVIKLKGDQLNFLGATQGKIDNPANILAGRHICTGCGKSYSLKRNLNAHMKKHPECTKSSHETPISLDSYSEAIPTLDFSVNTPDSCPLPITPSSELVTPSSDLVTTSSSDLDLSPSTTTFLYSIDERSSVDPSMEPPSYNPFLDTRSESYSLDPAPTSINNVNPSVQVTQNKQEFDCKHCGKTYVQKKSLHNHEVKCKAKALKKIEKKIKDEVHIRKQDNYEALYQNHQREILYAYFNTLINTRKVHPAYEEFKLMRNNPDGRKFVTHNSIYDQLLRGFAREHDFAKLQEVWKDMATNNVEPSIESFISAFICLSNEDLSKNVFKAIVKKIYSDFTESNFSISEALLSENFSFDDKNQFRTCIGSLGVDISLSGPNTSVSNELLGATQLAGSSGLLSQVTDVMTRDQLSEAVARQMEMELGLVVRVPSICPKEDIRTSQVHQRLTDRLEDGWRNRLETAISSKLHARKNLPLGSRGSTINMRQFLSCLPVNSLASIILAQARNMITNSDMFSLPVNLIIRNLGEEVMNTYHMTTKTKYDEPYWTSYNSGFQSYLDWYSSPTDSAPTHKAAVLEATSSFNLSRRLVDWPESVRVAVGTEMFNIMIREITMDRDADGNVIVDNQVLRNNKLVAPTQPVTTCPAFFKIFRTRKGNREVEEVKPHPSLSRVYVNKMVDLEFNSNELPMVCPPLPWVSTNTGGYLVFRSKLIKVPDHVSSEQESQIAALPAGSLDPVLDSVNQLSGVPWMVNQRQLEVATKVFTNQSEHKMLSATGLPLHPDEIPSPELNEELQGVLARGGRLAPDQVQEYQQFINKKSVYAQVKSESYSLWCGVLYRLSLAHHFKEQVLWFPHNIDFRGRCYPLPPLFNHMGADLDRSLLVFAQGKPLGPGGLDWLKLHCINLTGLKKRESVSDRLAYANEILDDIIDSAERPLEGRQWWLSSDDPWQTLSVCFEVQAALTHPEGPEEYVSHLPIHQDGSCNGLQHYAAIGRDLLGAKAVNLVPAEVPQDVYSEIAAIVERKRKVDGEKGLEVARELEGFVQRKVVKQTVMTTVYGVTKFGAIKQIARQLKDLDTFPLEHVDAGSKYLTKMTFESLNEMFTASQEIQNWLTECAGVIAGGCESNVSWVTPLGLPVVQPYTKLLRKPDTNVSMDMTNMFKQGKKNLPFETTKKINAMKHRNGFPPNFIHSLDSSHMMLTSLHLWSKGVTFASVHDCYWTHAQDVKIMNETCRNQFIALHSFPILERLSEHFLQNFMEPPSTEGVSKRKQAVMDLEFQKHDFLFKDVPKKGDLDLSVVKDSVYFFS